MLVRKCMTNVTVSLERDSLLIVRYKTSSCTVKYKYDHQYKSLILPTSKKYPHCPLYSQASQTTSYPSGWTGSLLSTLQGAFFNHLINMIKCYSQCEFHRSYKVVKDIIHYYFYIFYFFWLLREEEEDYSEGKPTAKYGTFPHSGRNPNLERLTITGKIAGRRSRGSRPMRWIDQIWVTLDTQLYEAIHGAEDQKNERSRPSVVWNRHTERDTLLNPFTTLV